MAYPNIKQYINLLHFALTNAYTVKYKQPEMWSNAQRGGRPAEYSWRLLFNAAKFG